MAVFSLGGIWSQFTRKLSGQLALAGKGDVGGEAWELLESEELWSSWMHGKICLGVAEMDTGSGMGKELHLYVLKSCALWLLTTQVLVPYSVLYNKIAISTFATWYFHKCRPCERASTILFISASEVSRVTNFSLSLWPYLAYSCSLPVHPNTLLV